MYFLGVDIGTSSVKAVLIDTAGQPVATAQQHYYIHEPQPGYREQDATLIKEAACRVISDVVGQCNDASLIRSVCFSAAMHSLLAVDSSHKSLTPALLWADTRSIAETTALKESSIASFIYHTCGTPVHPMLPLCKLQWLKKNQPSIFATAFKFISIKEYICFALTGKYIIDHSIASATGLFNIHTLQWEEKALEAAGIHASQLSTPVSTHWHTGEWAPGVLLQLGLPPACAFVIGSSDGCMANNGSGIAADEDLALTIGTSAAVRITTATPVTDKEESLFNYVLSEGQYISGGASNNGAVALDWLSKELFHVNDTETLTAEAFSIAPGSEGLIILPYFMGERAPVWDAAAKSIVYGLQLHHTRDHFARATIEGISMNLYTIAAKLLAQRPQIKRIVASGGFIQSLPWVQLIADIFNLPVHVISTADASALGAACHGAASTGLASITPAADKATGTVFHPIEENNLVYRSNYRIFSLLYTSNRNNISN